MFHVGVPAAVNPIRFKTSRATKILRSVAKKHRLKVEDIIGPRKTQDICLARFEAAWRMRTRTDMSLPAIGRKLGGRDHSTVLHAIRRFERMRGNGGPAERPTARLLDVIRRTGFDHRCIQQMKDNLGLREYWRRRDLFIIAAKNELLWPKVNIARATRLHTRRVGEILYIARRKERATASEAA